MIAFETGINWTWACPSSARRPTHGTAYDIAGKGIANPSSMRARHRRSPNILARSRMRKFCVWLSLNDPNHVIEDLRAGNVRFREGKSITHPLPRKKA